MANIIKQLKQGEDLVLPITHEDAVIDSAGVSIKDKIDALAELIKNNTGGKELVHEVEVWADYECTTRPTGEVDHVYVQLNRDFKFNQTTNYGTTTPSGGEELVVYAPTPESSTDPYAINCWIDFISVDQTSYFTAGQVILCRYLASPEEGTVDVTGYQTSFGELIPKPEIQRYRGVITNVSNVPLPTLLVNNSKFAVICKKDYDRELVDRVSAGLEYCLDKSLEEGVYIPVGRVLIGRQERKDWSAEDCTYAWRRLVIKEGDNAFTLGIHPDDCSEGSDTYDFLENDSYIDLPGHTIIYIIGLQVEGYYDLNIEAIELYDFKAFSNLVITGVPELSTASGNIRNVTIDTTAYGELTSTDLYDKLLIQGNDNTTIEKIDSGNYITVRDGISTESLFKISKSSTPTIWEVECLLPAGTGPEITAFQAIEDSWVPIYNDGREE